MTSIRPTRDAGCAHLAAFAPRMGLRYAGGRNFDHGPQRHQHVSTLSPWLRRRLITEHEIVAHALAHHGPEAAEKFIQEVFWRGYFKGWLERRPGIWHSYRAGLTADLEALGKDRALAHQVAAAENGSTGLACFDEWARELIETGYLHNHARMWFASIWIFTFGLPWRVGADFFLRHLLDGDPASNTLSWRWVAGLHTRGKTYQAQAWNIAKFTQGRFSPREADLAADAPALTETEPDGLPQVRPLRQPASPEASLPSVLLITEDDCCVQEFDLAAHNIRGAAALRASHLRSPRAVAEHVAAFEEGALADAAARVPFEVETLRAGHPPDLARWAAKAGARQILTPYIPEGYLRDWLIKAAPALDAKGIRLAEWQRDWDRLIWPHATAGFFKVKKAIPEILQHAGLS